MKLIELDTKIPMVILNYAHEHNLKFMEVGIDLKERNKKKAEEEITKKLLEENCTEYCFHKEMSDYNIFTNEELYRYSFIGFRPLQTDSSKDK